METRSVAVRTHAGGCDMNSPELLLYNGAITTLDPVHPQVSAVAISGGRITATGGDELLATADGKTVRIDLKGRRGHPRPERFPHPRHPGRPQLQHGAALGRRAVAGIGAGDAPRAGPAHPAPPVGAGDRRLDGVPVCRAADADAGLRSMPLRARYAGVRPASLRPGHGQQGRTAGARLHEGDPRSARRGDSAGQERQSHRPPHRQAECPDPLRQPGHGAEARLSTTRSTRPATSCAS